MKRLYIKTLVVAGILSLACTTKVSEWVLLNAAPGQYSLVYLHKNPISEKTSGANMALAKSLKGANVTFRDVENDDAVQPYYALYFGKKLFARYGSEEELKDLAISPLRKRISGEIMAGKLCVMLFLGSGNREKDEKGLAIVKRSVAASPFRDIIVVAELDRQDQAEKHFVSMLLNVESDLKNIREPMLFGIFGKLRAMEPLVAGGITGENIDLLIDFLTADCSCLIKDGLPGTDILCMYDWTNPAPAQLNAILDANPALMHQ